MLLRIVCSCLITFIALSTSVAQNEQKVKISTDFGDMIAILYNDTPKHRDNFLEKVKEGAYNGTLFHRVIENYIAQGGNPASVNASQTQALSADQCADIPSEIHRHRFHKKGALAASRLPDQSNPERKSGGCQFYIVHGNKYSDQRLDGMETEYYKFPDTNRAYYKVRGGIPRLDMTYTVFGEIIEGFEVIELIHAVPTGKYVKERPNQDIKMNISLID